MIATASPIAAGEEQALVLVDASAARDFIAGRTAKRGNATSDHVSMLTAKSFVSFRYECVYKSCVCVCLDVFGKQKEIISKICSSCNGCVWKCVWVCLCWLRLLCFVRSVVMKMEIRFGFPLRAFGERVWNCQKSYETFILFSFLLLLLLFLLFDALLRTTRGRGRRRELPLVALLQTLCICQADCPKCPLVFPPGLPLFFWQHAS